MANSILDQLSELTDEELELLKTVSQKGAATPEEVALQMDRPGDDLSTQMDQMVEKGVMDSQKLTVGDEEISVYQVDPRVAKSIRR